MPRPNHIDNGPIRFIATIDCENCGEIDAVEVTENDFYAFENCRKCNFSLISESHFFLPQEWLD